jgi:hypothetical protein
MSSEADAAARIASLLATGDPAQREVAYVECAEGASTVDGAASVARTSFGALSGLMCQAEVGQKEFRRIALLVGTVCEVGGTAAMDEWMSDRKVIKVQTSAHNALAEILTKDAGQLSREDMLTSACAECWLARCNRDGWDVMSRPGEFLGSLGELPWLARAEDGANLRMATLALEALNEEGTADSLTALQRAGVWWFLYFISLNRPAVILHLIEAGMMRTIMGTCSEPHSWIVPEAADTAGAGMLLCASFVYGAPDECKAAVVANAPGLSSSLVDMLRAYEALGPKASEHRQNGSFYLGVLLLQTLVSGEFFASGDPVVENLRSAPSTIQFVLDNPTTFYADFGLVTDLPATHLAAYLFGRDEKSPIKFSKENIDAMLPYCLGNLDATFVSGIYAIDVGFMHGILNLCVSDAHKQCLLENSGTLPLLLLGLFLEPNHPRGLNAVPPATPTPTPVQASHQRICTECLQQLALFPSGRDRLLQDASVMSALEAVVERGLSAEAKDHARAALAALNGFAEREEDIRAANQHVMLSYNWEHQSIVVRLNQSLLGRGYTTWFVSLDIHSPIAAAASYMRGSALLMLTDLPSRLCLLLHRTLRT